jgi:hypothetical protein
LGLLLQLLRLQHHSGLWLAASPLAVHRHLCLLYQLCQLVLLLLLPAAACAWVAAGEDANHMQSHPPHPDCAAAVPARVPAAALLPYEQRHACAGRPVAVLLPLPEPPQQQLLQLLG